MSATVSKESISIPGGLGPFQKDTTLEIRPLTVFIGPQGTGKSLVSQMVYFFRDAQYLLARYSAQQSPDVAVRKVIEEIRSGGLTKRALASFLTTKSVRIYYEHANIERKISINRDTREIRPLQPFFREINGWLDRWLSDPSAAGEVSPAAVFVPAERTFFSRFINSDPNQLGGSVLPLTMREFARVLLEAANIYQSWQDQASQRPEEADYIADLVRDGLGGEIKYSRRGLYARKWQWLPTDSEQPIEIEMASSGQMEAWPLVFTSQAMFDWKEGARPRFLHIEEPEAHLHPAAQVAIVKLLAYLMTPLKKGW